MYLVGETNIYLYSISLRLFKDKSAEICRNFMHLWEIWGYKNTQNADNKQKYMKYPK